MPVVTSLLSVFGATLGIYVLNRYLTLPDVIIPDLNLSNDEMCGLTTGGMDECWWGCTFKRKILPFISEYSVRYFVIKQQTTITAYFLPTLGGKQA